MEAIRTLCDVVLCTYMCNVFKHKCIAVLSVFITMTEYCKCMHDGILYVYPHTVYTLGSYVGMWLVILMTWKD
jgi:hypothetical protein